MDAIADDQRAAQQMLGHTEREVSYMIGGRMAEYHRPNLGVKKRKPMLQEYLSL